jgi:hypothetical protein
MPSIFYTPAVRPSTMLRPTGKSLSVEESMFIRETIGHAENTLRQSPQALVPGVDMPEVNHFADGMYARELFMAKGTIFTSKIHKTNHFLFVLKGVAQVIDEKNGEQLMRAPAFLKTEAGTKRVIRILEDSVWITVHATDKTDVDEIEKDIISEDYLEELIWLGGS